MENVLDAMNKSVVFGENGHAEVSLDSFNDDFVGLFEKLIRGLDESTIKSYCDRILSTARKEENVEVVKSLFLLAFSTRWCRGGKGEKKLFYFLMKELYRTQPQVALGVLDLVPTYGYWKDLFLMLQEFEGVAHYDKFMNKVYSICAEQHKADLAILKRIQAASEEKENSQSPSLSLYSKFVPSEKSSLDKALGCVKQIAKRVYGDVKEKKMIFRRDISMMRKELKITERFMCANEFSKIDFSRVPSVCMKKNTLAFLNDTKGAGITQEGTRFPGREDRVLARNRLIACIKEKGVKGKQLFPHELVSAVLHKRTSATGRLVLDAQWKALVQSVVNQVEARKRFLAEKSDAGGPKGIDLGNAIVMADVSGSMSGVPMEVAIALGVLCSEVTHPAYRNICMTFSSQPQWHSFEETASFTQKVESLSNANWGMSTDIYKAMKKIGELVVKHSLKEDEIPTLIIVSDMQFDVATGKNMWDSASRKIKDYFKQLGRKVSGNPFSPPKIIFWNVRAGNVGFPCDADEEGVALMSGYSPALMKFVLSGELEVEDFEVDEETGEVIKVQRQITPKDMLVKVLEDEGLNEVRSRLDALEDHIQL